MNHYKYFKTYDQITCSIHESGHALCALFFNMKVDMVHLFDDKKTKRVAGMTYFIHAMANENDSNALFTSLIESEICVNYAGLLAEKCHFKKISGSDKYPGSWKNGSFDDTTSAARLLSFISIPGKERHLLKKKIMGEAYFILNKYWDDITLISHALFKKRKIFFSDLKNILTKKSKNKVFWKKQFRNIIYIFGDK